MAIVTDPDSLDRFQVLVDYENEFISIKNIDTATPVAGPNPTGVQVAAGNVLTDYDLNDAGSILLKNGKFRDARKAYNINGIDISKIIPRFPREDLIKKYKKAPLWDRVEFLKIMGERDEIIKIGDQLLSVESPHSIGVYIAAGVDLTSDELAHKLIAAGDKLSTKCINWHYVIKAYNVASEVVGMGKVKDKLIAVGDKSLDSESLWKYAIQAYESVGIGALDPERVAILEFLRKHKN